MNRKQTLLLPILLSSQLLWVQTAYAAAEKRFDQTFMAAILTIFRYFSVIPLAGFLGFLFLSIKEERPELKGLAFKCLGAFAVLYMLLPAARVGGFA